MTRSNESRFQTEILELLSQTPELGLKTITVIRFLGAEKKGNKWTDYNCATSTLRRLASKGMIEKIQPPGEVGVIWRILPDWQAKIGTNPAKGRYRGPK
jgi:hypothetical protein